MRGSNYHCSDMSDEQLKEMLIDEHNCIRSKIIDLKSRSALLRKLWASQCLSDYTTQEVPHHAPTADGGGADASRNLPAGGDDVSTLCVSFYLFILREYSNLTFCFNTIPRAIVLLLVVVMLVVVVLPLCLR